MTRLLLAALAASLVLVGCGSEADDETATDPTPSASAEQTPSEPPSPEPTVGTYPDFEPESYSYTLAVVCYCPDSGVPVRITVVDGEAVEAVYAQDGRGTRKGDQAPEYRRLTIDEIIEAANDTEADSVKVKWLDGQDYPSSVSVDENKMMVDEEIGYLVSDVVVA